MINIYTYLKLMSIVWAKVCNLCYTWEKYNIKKHLQNARDKCALD